MLREIRSVEADSHVEPVAVHAAAEIAGLCVGQFLHLFLRGHDSGLSRVGGPRVVKRDVVIVPFDSRFQQVEEDDDALVVFGLVAGYARFVARIDGFIVVQHEVVIVAVERLCRGECPAARVIPVRVVAGGEEYCGQDRKRDKSESFHIFILFLYYLSCQ